MKGRCEWKSPDPEILIGTSSDMALDVTLLRVYTEMKDEVAAILKIATLNQAARDEELWD